MSLSAKEISVNHTERDRNPWEGEYQVHLQWGIGGGGGASWDTSLL
jgi:hypothetical protein